MKKSCLFLFCSLFWLATFLYGAEEEEELIAAVDNLGPNAAGFVAEKLGGPEDQENVNKQVLRDFVESRGLIECRQKGGQLTLAADVRARWIVTGEEVDGVRVRGQETGTALNVYKSELNLFLDYVAPKAWVSTKTRWVAFLGLDGGTATKTELDRAFIGYDIYEKGEEDFYIEVGRSNLSYMFESRVEYGSNFDGIHLYYTNEWKNVGIYVVHGGPFLIDSFTNHYGWIGEAGLKKWAGTGFSAKYSMINWNRSAPTLDYGNLPTSGNTTIRNNPRYKFLVSQLILGYEQSIDWPGCKILYLYLALLTNHAAQKSRTTHDTYANKAWYLGFTFGKLCKAFDWSLDINYQWVQAQAIPEFDLSGIGHGNAQNTLLSDAILFDFDPFDAKGFTNYRGWQMSLLYALTDSLTLRTKAEWSRPIDKKIGGSFKYKNFEMAVIYAF